MVMVGERQRREGAERGYGKGGERGGGQKEGREEANRWQGSHMETVNQVNALNWIRSSAYQIRKIGRNFTGNYGSSRVMTIVYWSAFMENNQLGSSYEHRAVNRARAGLGITIKKLHDHSQPIEDIALLPISGQRRHFPTNNKKSCTITPSP